MESRYHTSNADTILALVEVDCGSTVDGNHNELVNSSMDSEQGASWGKGG